VVPVEVVPVVPVVTGAPMVKVMQPVLGTLSSLMTLALS
jgi:hypothetical protein